MHRVLIADDEEDIAGLLRLRLERRGYEVVSVSNGNAALEEVERSQPDLAFLDVSMPGMTGIELLAELRGRGSEMGVIVMTAFSSDQSAIEALRGGADDYLRKPFQTTEFEVVLERTARRVELTRRNTWLQQELDDKRRRLEEEMARAAEVQADLLPADLTNIPGFEIAGRCHPALDVGGDFYDWVIEGDRLTFILADVMGKGMSAALLMATVRAAFRAGNAPGSAAVAVRQAARALEPDLIRSGRFVTFFLGKVDLTTGEYTYVDAGHGYGYQVTRTGVKHLEPCGLPLGAVDHTTYEEITGVLAPGDLIVVFSDGVIDVDEARGEVGFLRTLAGEGAEGAVARIAAIPDRLRVLSDDATAIVLYRRAEPA